MDNLTLSTKNTWCPGCGNFPIFESLKQVISSLEKSGEKKENFVLSTGIGCHAKISDYININTVYGLHGRSIPVAVGIKTGNKNLKVVCCSGDGDSYNEGISHLIHAAKRNSDITVIIHNNRTFALTVKQFTSTSPEGFQGSTTPKGSIEEPFNPLELMLASGATFIARSYVANQKHLSSMIEAGIKHKGFSFIEVLQPCVAWFNTYKEYNEKVYEYKMKNLLNKEEASSIFKEWDYNSDKKIAIGLFYQINKPTFEDKVLDGIDKKEKIDIKKILKSHI
jgi:2-oxoglutarate/2-oxoacid ferredoxin oxidoreductase subunit beta